MENGEGQQHGRQELDLNLDDMLGKEAQSVGKDIKPGSYPATFAGFSKPFMLTGKFGTTKNVELLFGIRDEDGDVSSVAYLCTLPEDANQINVRSNMFKALKAIDRAKFDKEGMRFNTGVKLKDFVGGNCMVTVELNDRDFAKITAIAQPVKGLKFPTKKELDDLPF
jgi:hypothetical protein